MRKLLAVTLILLSVGVLAGDPAFNRKDYPLYIDSAGDFIRVSLVTSNDQICSKVALPANATSRMKKNFIRTELIVAKEAKSWKTDCVTFHGPFVSFVNKATGMIVVCVPDTIEEVRVAVPAEDPKGK